MDKWVGLVGVFFRPGHERPPFNDLPLPVACHGFDYTEERFSRGRDALSLHGRRLGLLGFWQHLRRPVDLALFHSFLVLCGIGACYLDAC